MNICSCLSYNTNINKNNDKGTQKNKEKVTGTHPNHNSYITV